MHVSIHLIHHSLLTSSCTSAHLSVKIFHVASRRYKLLTKSKSSGQDGISANMLKNTAAGIAPSITKLFNMSLATGIVSSQWKKSSPFQRIPLQSLNYILISLLLIISKTLEHSLILEHLEVNYPLSAYQWGFLENRSTVSALLYCTNKWFKALENGNEVCTVFFYFQKALIILNQ